MTREELIRLKTEKGYSAAQLSEYSGVPLGTLTKILSGQTRQPRYETLQQLETFLLSDPGRRELGYEGVRYDSGKLPPPLMVGERAIAYGAPQKRQGEYTVQDLEMLPEGRYAELIDGVLYDLAQPTYTHQSIAQEMYLQIRRFIDENGGPCEVNVAGIDVFADCDDKTDLVPDLFVVCDPEKILDKGIWGAPDFVMEVLSPSTGRKDQTVKFNKYMTSGVREYWIIDPKRRQLIIYDYEPGAEAPTTILPLKGTAGLRIYGGRCRIDLDRIAAVIDRFRKG